jgi:hypothetical protein
MCLFGKPHFDRKTRLFYAAGNFCLAASVALSQLGPRWGLHHQVLLDALRGFFVGLSITLLLYVARLKRRTGPSMAGNP